MRAFWAFAFLPLSSTAWGQEKQDNPEYKAWASFPAGAWVKHRHVEDSADTVTEREITNRLIDLSPEKAVLEVEIVRIANGIRADVHRDRLEIPARIGICRCPDRGEDREVMEGEEELTVGAEKLMCRWVEIVETGRFGKSFSKVWSCRDIPGEIVNMESRQEESSLVRITTTLLAWCRE
jgi:hypothetical protein